MVISPYPAKVTTTDSPWCPVHQGQVRAGPPPHRHHPRQGQAIPQGHLHQGGYNFSPICPNVLKSYHFGDPDVLAAVDHLLAGPDRGAGDVRPALPRGGTQVEHLGFLHLYLRVNSSGACIPVLVLLV